MTHAGLEALTVYSKASKEFKHIQEIEPNILMETLGCGGKDCEKVYACQTVVEQHSPFEQFHVFQNVAIVFNDRAADFLLHQDLSSTEIVWAVYMMRMLDPVFPFRDEVLAYMATILHEDGLVRVPAILAKEKSMDGLNVQYFLNQANRNTTLTADGERVHNQKMRMIDDYVQDRQAKLLEELEAAGLK
jgi:hypothetical protein